MITNLFIQHKGAVMKRLEVFERIMDNILRFAWLGFIAAMTYKSLYP
jgi:hypothetical protein